MHNECLCVCLFSMNRLAAMIERKQHISNILNEYDLAFYLTYSFATSLPPFFATQLSAVCVTFHLFLSVSINSTHAHICTTTKNPLTHTLKCRYNWQFSSLPLCIILSHFTADVQTDELKRKLGDFNKVNKVQASLNEHNASLEHEITQLNAK